MTWQYYNDLVNAIADDDPVEWDLSCNNLAQLHNDDIRAQLGGLDALLFSGGLSKHANMLNVSMAMGSISVCNELCEFLKL